MSWLPHEFITEKISFEIHFRKQKNKLISPKNDHNIDYFHVKTNIHILVYINIICYT